MVMHAYSEEYLYSAQRIMGDMFDYASDSYEMDLDVFLACFLYRMWRISFRRGIQVMWREKQDVNW